MKVNLHINKDKSRFDLKEGGKTMKAVVTMGNGGYEMLEYKDVPMPVISEGEVLIKVLAAGVNNTEINTRLGWYSQKVTQGTHNLSDDKNEIGDAAEEKDGGWNAETPFPFIQGTDCAGLVVEAKDEADQHLVGKRVLIRACIRDEGFDSPSNVWMASDFDGAFAQYVKITSSEVFLLNATGLTQNWALFHALMLHLKTWYNVQALKLVIVFMWLVHPVVWALPLFNLPNVVVLMLLVRQKVKIR